MTPLLAAWYTNITDPRWWEQFLHPGELRDKGGYWFYSGIFALSYLSGLLVALRHLNCHQPRCARRGSLLHAESGTRWCRKHAPADLAEKHPLRHIHWPHRFTRPPTNS